jgi:hypothetical protein
MRSILRRLAWLVGSALIIILFTTIGSAQFKESSTTIDQRRWTDKQVKTEFNRYKFTDLEFLKKANLAKPNLVILSGFSKVGRYWKDLETPAKENAPAAITRREELVKFYESPASLRISVLAKLIRLIKTERQGDWICDIGYGCYPKGYVVGLGPVDSETAKLVCELQRRNLYFCGVYER